ncbi:meiosis induction protein kinase IME2/SME1, partial [Tremellales sp. Uapishka_1]
MAIALQSLYPHEPIMSSHSHSHSISRLHPSSSHSSQPYLPSQASIQLNSPQTPQEHYHHGVRESPARDYPTPISAVPQAPSGMYGHPSPVWQDSHAGPSRHQATPDSLPGQGSRRADSSSKRGKESAAVRKAHHIEHDEGDGRVGVDDPVGERSYTELKCVGDGSFGTVWLCDWHSPVKSGTLLSAMQCGAGARPEWAGNRLVALKRMKRVWEGGWKEARTLGELVSLRRIPSHPAIIPLYDAFISPKSRELYFVFECMEGNLYQLTKSRKGRPLAAGLIASCFHQISTGLHHIHQHGYFHRDMKPENLLVTTTGLTDYLSAAALNHLNANRNNSIDEPLPRTPNGHEYSRYEKDVAVIVKLADFGLARATASRPPYTEYVSTRWYRAPEVLLRSTEYGPSVDMWALGTILAEMLNLKPLFPGVSEIDQVYRICDTLGDPSPDYGVDERGRTVGGGSWNSGIKLAKNVGFSFPKRPPVRFRGLFQDSVPQSLVDCIADLLLYNPKYRLTSAQCVDHPYFQETLPHLHRAAQLPRIPFSQGQPPAGSRPLQPELYAPPRQLPPSHSHAHHDPRPAFANGDMRTLPPPVGTPDNASQNGQQRLFFPPHHNSLHGGPGENERILGASALVHQLRELDLPTEDLSSYGHRAPPSPVASSVYSFGGDRIVPSALPQRQQRWPEETGRQPSLAASTLYDGSVFEGSSQASLSNASFSNFQSLSISNLQREGQYQQASAPNSNVAAFVQQQQHQTYADETTPRQSSTSTLAMPPVIVEPTRAGLSKAGSIIGKKKKWGLSSVFGGGEKSTTDLAPVDENAYTAASSSSLKRTQSGNRPEDRGLAVELDPKKAKKEAERQARELEKAKREAAERAQKERARAVMAKRNQLVEARKFKGNKTEIEYGNNFTVDVDGPPKGTPMTQPPILTAAMLGSQAGSSRDIKNYPAMAGTQSLTSIRSHGSHHSSQSNHSAQDLQKQSSQYDLGGMSRHKARKIYENDDHSQSSLDRNSFMSRSVLTVGTVDSDPGPGRSTRHDWPDPLHHSPKRTTSVSSFNPHPSLNSRSNVSIDSQQLAKDFQTHATMSSTSLGRHGASNLSLNAQTQHSAPTSPYGQPKGLAVASGGGMGRILAGGPMLPSISSWEHLDQANGQINPMFVVVRRCPLSLLSEEDSVADAANPIASGRRTRNDAATLFGDRVRS